MRTLRRRCSRLPACAGRPAGRPPKHAAPLHPAAAGNDVRRVPCWLIFLLLLLLRLRAEEMAVGLRRLGYDLQPSEVAVLMQQLDVDADGAVDAPGFVASQLDWGVLQSSNRCARACTYVGACQGRVKFAERALALLHATVQPTTVIPATLPCCPPRSLPSPLAARLQGAVAAVRACSV